MFIFLDDILIYSKNEVEHEEHMRLILQVLREHQLYVKLNNYDFYQSKVQYLGHFMFEDGIAVSQEKITTIKEWPTPKDMPNVIYFMGLARYYC